MLQFLQVDGTHTDSVTHWPELVIMSGWDYCRHRCSIRRFLAFLSGELTCRQGFRMSLYAFAFVTPAGLMTIAVWVEVTHP